MRPSTPLTIEELLANTTRRGDCMEWNGKRDGRGYPRLYRGGVCFYVHRDIVELSTGKRLARRMFALHSCDNPPCINPAHLRAGSWRENNQDAAARQRARLGERHHHSSLTAEIVREARRLKALGRSTPAIAKALGCGDGALRSVFRGETWKHVV